VENAYSVRFFFERGKLKTIWLKAKSREDIYNKLISDGDCFYHKDEKGVLHVINLRQTKYVSISAHHRSVV
jgi:hypothetical protein